MKGVIFNILEQAVVRAHGDAAWDALLERSGADGAYTAVGSYDDGELFRIVGAASELLGLEPDEIVRWFGREAIGLLFDRYPYDEDHDCTSAFLRTLDDIVHPEVEKLYPGAIVPRFEYEGEARNHVILHYRSPRRLCTLAEGMIEGAAARFGETVEIEHRTCLKRGDDRCSFVCDFERVA